MATVHFSPEALNDLGQIKNYIQNDLEKRYCSCKHGKKDI